MANKKTIVLLIEDDLFLLGMYANKLALKNFTVIIAEDGEKGLKLAKQELPDIIILDIILPKKNGLEVLKELKISKATSKIPVILLTNLSQEEEIKKGFALGAKSYLIKAHFTPEDVVEEIRKVLGGK